MFMTDPKDDTPIVVPAGAKATLLITMGVTVFLGVYPEPLSILANLASKALFF
jgi:NADH-quinone oxidoreductase subunit N